MDVIESYQGVMGRIETYGDNVGFGQWMDTEGWHIPVTIPVVMLARHKWEELGEPETITVTIEPGDKYNRFHGKVP